MMKGVIVFGMRECQGIAIGCTRQPWGFSLVKNEGLIEARGPRPTSRLMRGFPSAWRPQSTI